ncbi:hypothetical protein [Peribacillus loiseleuriae]|nr:hypothetical protein [Peribacillus loiseleuriae]
MYLIEWGEAGKIKWFVAEGYIERLVCEERLENRGIEFNSS